MKVLFAVDKEEISEAIVKRYQQEYKQIISYKNVYYFNAILKELQKDKSYDRVVISEDLETFTHTQYDQIDKFIFDKLDNISDEASNSKGNDIPIILICSERRTKSEEMLVKLFGIGIYNAIIGTDRSVEEVCRLIHRPRLKKDAKNYYKIESDNVNYHSENENDVSEMEIQNILAHYKRLGKNEEKYIESFENIAAQYNDTQLRIISKFLPLNVRAVLEEQSPKYQKIMAFNNKVSDSIRKPKTQVSGGPTETLLKPKTKDRVLSTPVVIPSAVNMNSNKKLSRIKAQPIQEQPAHPDIEEIEETTIMPGLEPIDTTSITELEPEPVPVKRGRGRPRKNPVSVEGNNEAAPVKRGRGRPRKNPIPEPELELEPEPEETILPGFEEPEEIEETTMPGLEPINTMPISELKPELEPEPEETFLPGLSSNRNQNFYSEPQNQSQDNFNTIDLSNLLTPDKKIVTFVGTSKNGTSFMVNNLAELLSTSGVNVAILDTTQNRNSYYIYTKNEEELRQIAARSIDGLVRGEAIGISVHPNLTVYTSLPDEGEGINNCDKLLETLLQKHSLILIDTDFKTPARYFEQSQETYLVQTYDILTIQPLTAFLNELKARGILDERKLRVILNKSVRIKGITDKTIIGGMAYYNDPAMSFMKKLFDRTLMKYIAIPFEDETYIKYLEGIIECNISLKGYSKIFMQMLKQLSNMVYPLTNTYTPPTFTPNINNTLDQMKNNY